MSATTDPERERLARKIAELRVDGVPWDGPGGIVDSMRLVSSATQGRALLRKYKLDAEQGGPVEIKESYERHMPGTEPQQQDASLDETGPDKWTEAIELCRGFVADRARFESEERTYKLDIAGRVTGLFDAAGGGHELASPLRDVLANPPNNLL